MQPIFPIIPAPVNQVKGCFASDFYARQKGNQQRDSFQKLKGKYLE
jgi:hypothetical protein